MPMYKELEEQLTWTPESYISASHVKYLESAGARVVPIDLDMHPKELQILMKKLNGVYIPGDHNIRGNPEYYRTVSEIVQHAQVFNEEAGNHFPIAAFGYGGLVLLQDSVKDHTFGHILAEDMVDKRFKLDYTKHPDDTFLFDSIKEADLVETFLRSYTYNTLDFGVSLQELRHNQEAIKSYSPTLLFKDSSDLIAGFEAHAFPFYGFTVRLDEHQFVFSKFDHIDHSAPARNFAQMVANHFVDEARLSPHFFKEEPAFMHTLDLTILETEDEFLEYYFF